MNAAIKARLLPTGRRIRRLPLGIGRGLRMGVDFQRGETRLYLGLYEIELNRHIRRLCRPGYRSFDIGGQYGYDALVLAKLTGAPVVSVECEPALASEIRENADANGELSRLIDVRVAYIARDTGNGRLSLDDLARETFLPDFVKMDIEGGEGEALEGSRGVLGSARPNMVVEVHGRDVERHCREMLAGFGYQLLVVDPRKWLPDRRPLAHNRWLVGEAPMSAAASSSGRRAAPG